MFLNKFLSFFTIFSLLFTSCARLNEDRVTIKIHSYPANADLYVNNAYYGKTPIDISLLPDSRDYKATIIGKDYRKTIDLETWYSVREGRGSENTRCVLDAFGSFLILPMASFLSIKCRDFKKREYLINAYGSD
jgi:hypothetical protein